MSANPSLSVEKLTHRKMVDETLQSEALQTTISVLVDIFVWLPIPAILTKQEFFDGHACFRQLTDPKPNVKMSASGIGL